VHNNAITAWWPPRRPSCDN